MVPPRTGSSTNTVHTEQKMAAEYAAMKDPSRQLMAVHEDDKKEAASFVLPCVCAVSLLHWHHIFFATNQIHHFSHSHGTPLIDVM
jgi:hypothetical protein